MVLFNYSTKELTAKVVYYGPGLCGKTTNLQWIHEKLPIKNKGKMLSLATEADRTLFFDFLPIELGTIRGMKTRIQLYTVPGQVFYNATRRMVLKGADCVVFVCDSQEAMLDPNLDSMENLRENLTINEIDPDEIPTVLQYNKRDLPNALPVEILNEKLNRRGLPYYEAVAMKGIGVEETLKGVTAVVFRSLSSKYGTPGEAKPVAPAAPPPVAPAAPAVPPPAPPPSPLPAIALAPAPAAHAEDLLDALDLEPAQEEAGPLDELHAEGLNVEPEPLQELNLEPDAEPAPGEFELEPEPPVLEVMREPTPAVRQVEPVPVAPPPAVTEAVVEAAPAPPEREVEPAPASPLAAAATGTPVPVAVDASGRAEISVPLEISLDGSTTRVQIQLHLTLDLKLRK